VKTDSTTLAPPCTLKAEGSIKGVVQLENNGNVNTVFILFMGTNTFVTPNDSIGNFTASNLAEGKYAVKILTTLPDYDSPMDTSFAITAGVDAVLPDTLRLRYTGIPVPQGLRIEYDTMKQIVSLIWNRPTTGVPLSGYNIYRKHQDSAITLLRADWQDTVYLDSSGIQDITYEYRVAAIDTNTTEGTRSGVASVVIAPCFVIDSTFGSTGSFVNQHGICFGQDSIILVADKQNSKIKRFTAQGHFLNQFGTAGTADGQFDQVWDVAMDDSGYIFTTEYGQPRIQKFDAQGNHLNSWQIPTTRGGNGSHLAVYDTNIYVTNVYSSEIIWYSTNGDSLGSFILPTEIGGFGYGGWDIITDKQRNIYVAVFNESYKLNNNGNVIDSFQLVPGSSTDPDPRCIAIDTTGNIFVACLSDMSIRVYDQTGNYLAKWGAVGNATGQFTFFSSMIITPDNSAFVSDGDLGRIQKFIRN
jgi:DNA-binding beta-propeller fold protein YncE